MKADGLREVIRLHGLWREGNAEGVRADLSGVDLCYSDLRQVDLSYADLSYADLTGSDLSHTKLRGAFLTGTKLRGVKLSHADLREIKLDDKEVPVIEGIHKRVYEEASRCTSRGTNHLDMSDWHSDCGTSHCRAGLVIHLAGEAGSTLENEVGPAAAGALIYLASDPQMTRVPDFYCSNEAALEDMQLMAESEVSQ